MQVIRHYRPRLGSSRQAPELVGKVDIAIIDTGRHKRFVLCIITHKLAARFGRRVSRIISIDINFEDFN